MKAEKLPLGLALALEHPVPPLTEDQDWLLRATFGRRLELWMGGLDGPPPSWEELDRRLEDLGAAADVTGLKRVREVFDRLEKGGHSLPVTLNLVRTLVEDLRQYLRDRST